MKIDLPNLKKIAKAVPDLSIAHLVAVLTAVVDVERDEKERDRIANKRQHAATTANIEQQPPTRADMERQLYAEGKEILGRNAGGLISSLLKAKEQNVTAAALVLSVAKTKQDPREYVASECRREGNGTRTGSVSSAADRLIAREKARTGDDTGPLLDLTPTSSRIS